MTKHGRPMLLRRNRVKQLVRSVLPAAVLQMFRKLRHLAFGRPLRFLSMPTSEVFDTVYREAIWGVNLDGESTSGSGSHSLDIVLPYVTKVASLISALNARTVVDLGCGDFNVGRYLVGKCERLLACDISSVIIERNKIKYKDLVGVDFLLLDLAVDELPRGDIALVRQVLQHLSNEKISAFAKAISKDRPYKYLVVTEHLPSADDFLPNLNKSSGPDLRLDKNSGVVLHMPPFEFSCRSSCVLLEVSAALDGPAGVLRTTLYEF